MKTTLSLTVLSLFSVATFAALKPGTIPFPTPVSQVSTLSNVANFSSKGPVTSPTFPIHIGENQPKMLKPHFETIDPPMPYNITSTVNVTLEDVEASDSTQVVLKDNNGKMYYFSQFKKLDGSFSVVIPKRFYDEIISLGYSLEQQDIQALSDEEYKEAIKDVKLVVFGKQPLASKTHVKYLGGEGGRCAAGTIGGAIGGGLAGGSVGGPAGAVAGAIGGALAGSAASCK
jgi:hypothetical protein